MDNRDTANDQAMREAANRLVVQLNEYAVNRRSRWLDREKLASLRTAIRDIWSTYFENGFAATDRDVASLLNQIPGPFWPKEIVYEAAVDIAAFLDQPVALQIDAARVDPESCYLMASYRNDHSQFGEDGIIDKIFEIMGARNEWCVEFGAWDGKFLSNTYRRVSEDGWNGILIEGDVARFEDLKATYADNERAHLINEMVGFDTEANTIDHLLGRTGAPRDLDLIVIDIDGNDWHIWNSMTDFWPRLVVIEFNPSIPNDVMFIQDRGAAQNAGCSLRALIELGKSKGYELVCATQCNGLFVRAEDFPTFDIADNSIDAMYAPHMDGRLFHGFDSRVHTIGMPYLLWDYQGHGVDWKKLLPGRLVSHD